MGKVSSDQPGSVRYVGVGSKEHDPSFFVRKSEHQHLGSRLRYLTGREVDHGRDLPSDKVLRQVKVGQLGDTFSHADTFTEIYLQFVGGVAGFRILFDFFDRSDTNVDLQEIIERDLSGRGRAGWEDVVHLQGYLGGLRGSCIGVR